VPFSQNTFVQSILYGRPHSHFIMSTPYGNFRSLTQPIDDSNCIPKDWRTYANPFWDRTWEKEWETGMTLQPKYDFPSENGEEYPITFVATIRGHDTPVEREIPDGSGTYKTKSGWLLNLDLKPQHYDDSRITIMKKAKNPLGLKRVHEFLLEADFFVDIENQIPRFTTFAGAGRSEYYGKGYKLGEMNFNTMKFREICSEIRELLEYVSEFGSELSDDGNINNSDNGFDFWSAIG
jgi:hypothetical protein